MACQGHPRSRGQIVVVGHLTSQHMFLGHLFRLEGEKGYYYFAYCTQLAILYKSQRAWKYVEIGITRSDHLGPCKDERALVSHF